MDWIDNEQLQEYQEEAKETGITLTELLLFKVLQKLDDLEVTTYSGDE